MYVCMYVCTHTYIHINEYIRKEHGRKQNRMYHKIPFMQSLFSSVCPFVLSELSIVNLYYFGKCFKIL